MTVKKDTKDPYINDDSLVQQALFLGSHDKVMCVVLVINNVLQIDTCKQMKPCENG